MAFIFHFIYGLSSFPLTNIFQRGRYTTNQNLVNHPKKVVICPPGSASNLFALLAGGDVALSVLMTITTTIGAATWRALNVCGAATDLGFTVIFQE
jgi:hypothetical protein